MENYSLNNRWGTHKVRLTWQIDDYKATGIGFMGGNCKGGSILSTMVGSIEDTDFEPVMDETENKRHLKVDEDGYLKEITMFNEAGDDMTVDEASLFVDCLVGVEIIGFEPEVRE